MVLGTFVAAPKAARANPPPEITAATFTAIHSPGFAVAVMNFRLRPVAATRTLLTTETRVFATDATSRRRFAAYWRVIYPGSAIIRMMWLRAIKRSARCPPSGQSRRRDGAAMGATLDGSGTGVKSSPGLTNRSCSKLYCLS